MKKGFYTIMSAQFFSSLADNALLVAAIELLKTGGSFAAGITLAGIAGGPAFGQAVFPEIGRAHV